MVSDQKQGHVKLLKNILKVSLKMVTYDKDIQKNKINYDYDYQMLNINNKTH